MANGGLRERVSDMGFAEIINPQLKVKTIMDDEMTRVPIEWCDKCQSWQDLHSGYPQRGNSNEIIMWFCGDCK